MPASALAFALAAAFLHAFWNVLVARARDPEAATAVAILVALVAYAPVAVASWHLESAVWPYLAVTACLQLGYTSLLAAAYRRAELSVVYPVARGAAPVLVLVAGVTALGAGTSWGQALGVCLVATGIVLVRGAQAGAHPAALLFGLAIAVLIAGYTLVDKRGIEHASPFTYLEISMLGCGAVYAAAVARFRGVSALKAEVNLASAARGLAMFGAYGLVLAALERAPAAPVAAVRETSIVIAAGLAALLLGEPVGPVRILGAAVVAGGVALISVS